MWMGGDADGTRKRPGVMIQDWQKHADKFRSAAHHYESGDVDFMYGF